MREMKLPMKATHYHRVMRNWLTMILHCQQNIFENNYRLIPEQNQAPLHTDPEVLHLDRLKRRRPERKEKQGPVHVPS